jgi:hypothetical protein
MMLGLVYDVLEELEREDALRRELFEAAAEDIETTDETVKQYDPDSSGGFI